MTDKPRKLSPETATDLGPDVTMPADECESMEPRGRYALQPWICPKCSRVYGPTATQCEPCNSAIGIRCTYTTVWG